MKKITKRLLPFMMGVILATCTLLLMHVPGSFAAGETLIRVALGTSKQQVDFRVAEGKYKLLEKSTGNIIAEPTPGEMWSVIKDGEKVKLAREGTFLGTFTGPISLQPFNEGQNLFRYQNIRYRGSLHIFNEPGGLVAVNSLGLEKYLYGVVGEEIGISAPREALKAQAVVSRSFAVSMMKGNEALYDLLPDTRSQVYGGYEAEIRPGADKVRDAVDATAGEVIYFNGSIVQAYFHANAGGYTEGSENVWSYSLPYLKPVPSPFDEEALKYPYQTNGWPANTYRWEIVLSREKLDEKIRNWNNLKAGKDLIDIGTVKDIQISKNRNGSQSPTESGRATSLKLVGNKGDYAVYKDSIRSLMGLRSTLFTMRMDSEVNLLSLGGKKARVTNGEKLIAVSADGTETKVNGSSDEYCIISRHEKRTVPKIFQRIVFDGKGHGHGVGMSQWGARGMAAQGYTYQQIIKYYYNQGRDDGLLKIRKLGG